MSEDTSTYLVAMKINSSITQKFVVCSKHLPHVVTNFEQYILTILYYKKGHSNCEYCDGTLPLILEALNINHNSKLHKGSIK